MVVVVEGTNKAKACVRSPHEKTSADFTIQWVSCSLSSHLMRGDLFVPEDDWERGGERRWRWGWGDTISDLSP